MHEQKPRPIKRVLLIEDDEDDVLIASDRLREIGGADVDVTVSFDKSQAVSYLCSNTFDLCLLDHFLGSFSGLEVLDALGDESIKTPIVMLTGQNDEVVERKAINKGAQDYIMKAAIETAEFEKSVFYAISRKELEISRITNERIRSENQAKDKFIAHLSHELRTPLTSILGYTSLLLENDMAAPLQKELQIIGNNGKHLLNLLNDVLDLSKISAGKFELQNRKTALHQLFVEVYSLSSVNALDKGLELICRSSTEIPHHVMLDEIRFKQVLINLLGNAIKFTDSGTVSLCISETYCEKPELCVEVKDTGIGMEQSQIDSIFQPFRQIEDVANRKAGGAGLGLSITAEIIHRMGGRIDVESSLDKGSTFTLLMPLVRCPDTDSSHVNINLLEPNEVISAKKRLRGKVLIVDDVFEIRQLVGHYVKQSGCSIEFARNGQLAVEAVDDAHQQNVPFDLVLMDLHMPVMTGVEAMTQIKRHFPHLPVIAMTAAIQKGTKTTTDDAGFSDLLAKPIEPDSLLTSLARYLGMYSESEKTESLEPKERVCLVEDDEDTASIMKILLTRLGYDVNHVSNGQACINFIKRNEAEIFLIDMGLPDMTGESLLDAVRVRAQNAVIHILSGSEIDAKTQKNYGVTSHMLKPVSLDTLKHHLEMK
ncbi:response regulator [Ningiella sp. W23]|uniref:response regulator n=1 Tax=Ningiella sp. W23 TaxID=3023715 RepID=UPI0037572D05